MTFDFAPGVLVFGTSAAAMAVAVRTVRRRFGDRPVEITAVVSTVVGAIISFFLLTLALLMVSATTALATATQNTYDESNAIRETCWQALSLPADEEPQVQAGLRAYTSSVVQQEWPLMLSRGQSSTATWNILDDTRKALTTATVPASYQKAKEDTLAAFSDIYRYRRLREDQLESGLPPLMSGSLILLGLIAVGCVLLVGWPKHPRYTVALSLFAGVMAFALWLVSTLNHPFHGAVHVTPDAFTTALQHLDYFR